MDKLSIGKALTERPGTFFILLENLGLKKQIEATRKLYYLYDTGIHMKAGTF